MLRTSLGAGFLAAAVNASGALAVDDDAASRLVAHRAVYDVQLKQASPRSGIEGARGRMVYEFTGSACTGFTTGFRLVTRIDTGEETRLSDQQTSNFEDLAAGRFHFETKTFTDEKPDRQISGDASLAAAGVRVELSGPQARTVELPASQFPTAHVIEIIRGAKQGKSLVQSRIFDGSDNGDQIHLTTAVIGKAESPQAGEEAGALSGASYWPVTIAYFNEASAGDPTPIYNMSFKLYENGVTRDLTMDYGEFILTANLVSLDLLPAAQGDCAKPR